jgi:aspartate/glutamate racemase
MSLCTNVPHEAQDQAQAQVLVAIVAMVSVTVRTAHVACLVVPRATTDSTF